MKKRGLAAALARLTMATTGTAFAATSFWQPVYYTNVGYNASTVKKVANADHAYIRVTESNHNELSTNYLVTRADNGVQMTQGAFVISNGDRSRKSNPYKSGYYQYSGNCVLRINAAQQEANYTVWGEWNPNG